MGLGEKGKAFYQRWLERRGRRPELKQVIWVTFTATAVATSLIMGLSFYGRFLEQTRETLREENQFLMEQASYSFSAHLRNMMKVSDSLYYSVIKKTDLGEGSVSHSFQLLYDTNKEYIERIALFSMDGELLQAAPAGKLGVNTNIIDEDWYWRTMASEENICFGPPEITHLFEPSRQEYTRVVPMTRVVQMTMGDKVEKGILLIQLRHSDFQDVFNNILLGGGSYLYLTDNEGEIIFHPQQELVESGYIKEAKIDLEGNYDGGFAKSFSSKDKEYFVKTIGYTGWKLVGVTQGDDIALNTFKSSLFILFLMVFFLNIIVVMNSYLSKKVSAPMGRLEAAVKKIEAGDLETIIEPSGFSEVWHLGTAVDNMKNNLKRLMEDIVKEHEAKRKSEIMALQNQINPHFLYNTLDIIVWMIENEKREHAVNAVTALARFFRISLSRGRTVIPVLDEVEHVRNYLMIQEMRFKNRFSYAFDIGEDLGELGTIKLILQPIVENAVYHAMEFMDGDGEIHISAHRQGESLLFTIGDNGSGMTAEMVTKLMEGETPHSERGSGVGFRNVQERIHLVFGQGYGLVIDSEPDEGTVVTITIPAISYETLRVRGLD